MLSEGPAQHLRHPGDDLVEVEHLRPHHLPARESKQLVGKAGGPFGGLFDLRDVAAGGFPASAPVRLGRGVHFLGDEGHVVEDHGQQVVEVVRDPASQLAQIFQALSLLQLRLQYLVPLQSLPALAVTPYVEPVLDPPGVVAHALDFRLDLVLGVAGITALRVDLDVVPLLGLTDITALGFDLLLEPLLSLTGVTAFSADLDIEPLLSLPRVAALALNPALGLVADALPLAYLPRHRGDARDDARLIDNRRHGQ